MNNRRHGFHHHLSNSKGFRSSCVKNQHQSTNISKKFFYQVYIDKLENERIHSENEKNFRNFWDITGMIFFSQYHNKKVLRRVEKNVFQMTAEETENDITI